MLGSVPRVTVCLDTPDQEGIDLFDKDDTLEKIVLLNQPANVEKLRQKHLWVQCVCALYRAFGGPEEGAQTSHDATAAPSHACPLSHISHNQQSTPWLLHPRYECHSRFWSLDAGSCKKAAKELFVSKEFKLQEKACGVFLFGKFREDRGK